jgi:hypothetical protein
MASEPTRPESFRPASNLEALRVPPQSVEAEQSVLGGLMLAPQRLEEVQAVLSESDFYRRDHRLTFRGMVELIGKNKPVDAVTLGEWFEASQLIEQVGGAVYLGEIQGSTPGAANLLAYAEIVRQKSLLRRAIELGTEIVNAGFQPEGRDAHQVLAEAQAGVDQLAVSAQTDDSLRPIPLLSEVRKPTPPRYVVDPYLPRGEVTLLASHGGAGKTTLAEIIACHVACGRWVFGKRVEAEKVAFVSFEDDGEKVAYKISKIVERYDLDHSLIRQNLRVFDWSEGDTALATEESVDGIRRLVATALWSRFKQATKGCGLLIADNASEAFDGDEINRRQVKRFMGMFREVARKRDAAALVLAHIDKAAARNGAQKNSYSGSTAWHNSARSRLALLDADHAIELHHEKNNLGPKAEVFRMRWAEHGVLEPIGSGAPTQSRDEEGTIDEGQDAAGVLKAFRAAATGGTEVRTGRTGPGNAHMTLSTFAALPQRLRGPKGRDRFWAVIDSLVDTQQLTIREGYTATRNPAKFFVLNTPIPPVVGTHETHDGDLRRETHEPTKPTKPTKYDPKRRAAGDED